MQAHYEALFDDNGNQDYTITNDFYTVISDAIDDLFFRNVSQPGRAATRELL